MIPQPDRARALLFSIFALAVAITANESAVAADLNVTVTIKPIHALVAQVMEGVGTPALLVTGASSPHTYALKPSDAKALYASDVVFRVSEAVEPFTGRIVKALPENVRVVTLSEAPGVEQLDVRAGDTFEAHAHGQDAHDDDHGAEADRSTRRRRSIITTSTPPTTATSGWTPPTPATWWRRSPASSPRSRRKTRSASRRTRPTPPPGSTALEKSITAELAPIKGRPFVVFHDAYQYFEHRFGLTAVGSITVSPEVQPSAKRLTEIRRKIAALDARCVFAEPRFQPNLVNAVIEGTQAHSGTLDPEGTMIDPGPEAYATLIKNLAAGLRSCLGEGS